MLLHQEKSQDGAEYKYLDVDEEVFPINPYPFIDHKTE